MYKCTRWLIGFLALSPFGDPFSSAASPSTQPGPILRGMPFEAMVTWKWLNPLARQRRCTRDRGLLRDPEVAAAYGVHKREG